MSHLVVPNHIRQSGVQDRPVDYEWRGTSDFNRQSSKVGKLLQTLSARACLACASGMAEWIVWRLEGLSDFRAPLDMIEASWAANVDIKYCKIPTVAEFEDRKGPVHGVLRATKHLVESALRSYNTPTAKNLAGSTVYLYFLARHVLPKRGVFDRWLMTTLARLAKDYGRSSVDVKGEPVPREVMDTTTEFQRERSPVMIADFLASLKVSIPMNPYLRTPDEMAAAGFEGTPYSWSSPVRFS